MTDEVEVQTIENGRIWIIALNRPHVRNSIDGKTATKLSQCLVNFDKHPDSLVAVLYGKGNSFCSGADLGVVSQVTLNYETRLKLSSVVVTKGEVSHDTSGPMGFSRLMLSKPVIAAVSGYAVAGGLELACWCDLRVAEENSTFGVFCRRWGVPLIDGGTVRLTRLIGLSRSMDMILTGRPVSGTEALSFGLVNRLVPTGTVLENAILLAKQIAAYPQACLRADRMSSYQSYDHDSILAAMDGEFKRAMPTIVEGREGAKKFHVKKQGRKGSFKEFIPEPAKL